MNQSPTHSQKQPDKRQAFPLAFVFIVVAFAATVIGICGPGISELVAGDSQTSLVYLGFCVIVCMVIGLLVGLHHYRRMVGAVIGVSTGAVLGPLLGATAATDDFDRLFIASLVGSAVIVLIGFFYSLKKTDAR